MAKRTLRQIKTKKKKWMPIYASKDFGEVFLGELLVSDVKNLEEKSLTINLMDITGNAKNQNVNIRFKVESVEGEKAFAVPVNYTMIPAGIKRFIRRGKGRIDDSFVLTTSDKKRIRIKFILVTKSKTKNSVANAIRKSAKYFLNKMISSRTYNAFYHDLVSYNIQRSLKSNLKKIYPLGVCEIRAVELDKRPVRVEHKEVETEEKKEEPEGEKVEKKEEKVEEKEIKIKEEKSEEKKEEEKREEKIEDKKGLEKNKKESKKDLKEEKPKKEEKDVKKEDTKKTSSKTKSSSKSK